MNEQKLNQVRNMAEGNAEMFLRYRPDAILVYIPYIVKPNNDKQTCTAHLRLDIAMEHLRRVIVNCLETCEDFDDSKPELMYGVIVTILEN